jgi:hypothetical protein
MFQALDNDLNILYDLHSMEKQVNLTDKQKIAKSYYQRNRERLLAHQHEYHHAHREERIAYQRMYNKKYYQSNKTVNVKARKIEEAIPITATASDDSLKEQVCKAEKPQKPVKQSPNAVPPDAKPWTFLGSSPKRQKHQPHRKKIKFERQQGDFVLSFD